MVYTIKDSSGVCILVFYTIKQSSGMYNQTVQWCIQSNSPESLSPSTGALILCEIHFENQHFFPKEITSETDVKYTTQNVHPIKMFVLF